MKKLISFLLFSFLLCEKYSYSQAPAIEWQKALGGGSGDYGQAIEPTTDGGYIVAGYTMSNDGDVTFNHHYDQADIWVVKINSTGGIQWQKSFGGYGWDFAYSVHQTADGGYILCGNTTSNDGDVTSNHGAMDCWLLKLDASGNLLWQKTYGGSFNEYGYCLQICSDGGYVLAGLKESFNADIGRDYWVLKVDAAGNIQWQKTYGGSGDDEAYSIATCTDGGYVVAGYTESNDGDVSGNHGKRDYWIIKLNSTGNIQWQKSLGGSEFDESYSIKQTSDGGYIVAGFTASNDGDVSGNHYVFHGAADFWVVKLDGSGNIQWQKCYGGDWNERAYDIQLTSDGGYLVGGFAQWNNGVVDGDVRCNEGYEDFWIIKINSSGVLQWQKNMGGNERDEIYALHTTIDGGAIVTGLLASTNVSGYHTNTSPTGEAGDMWVIKLSANIIGIPHPTISINPHVPSTCAGSNLTLTAMATYSGTAATYEWKKNGVVVGTDVTYSSNSFANNDVVICKVTTPTNCNTNADFASDTVTIHVSNSTPPTLSINADQVSVCSGTTVTFTASVSAVQSGSIYVWKKNGNIAGSNSNVYADNALSNGDVITCTYHDDAFCAGVPPVVSNAITEQVFVSVTPTITITSSGSKICAGTDVVFNANTNSAGSIPSFEWTLNGVLVGTNSNSYHSALLSNGDVINCIVHVDPSLKCATPNAVTSNNITMTVNPGLPPTISIIASQNQICEGNAVTFTAQSQNEGSTPSYQWKVNSQIVGTSVSFTSNKLKNGDQVSCLLQPGADACSTGSVNSNVISMQVSQLPIVSISPEDTIIKPNDQVIFKTTVSGSVMSFQWSPANELVDPNSLSTVTTQLSKNTEFMLTVVSDDGCSGAATAIVKIARPLKMPNAFSPNGDFKNDVFRIPPNVLFNLTEFSVFNRWGQKIFSTRNISQGWDGTVNGKLADAGVYVYIVTGKDEKGEVTQKGTVTLIR